jgi:hypothetical protein
MTVSPAAEALAHHHAVIDRAGDGNLPLAGRALGVHHHHRAGGAVRGHQHRRPGHHHLLGPRAGDDAQVAEHPVAQAAVDVGQLAPHLDGAAGGSTAWLTMVMRPWKALPEASSLRKVARWPTRTAATSASGTWARAMATDMSTTVKTGVSGLTMSPAYRNCSTIEPANGLRSSAKRSWA